MVARVARLTILNKEVRVTVRRFLCLSFSAITWCLGGSYGEFALGSRNHLENCEAGGAPTS